jgi:hypothetical protein
LIRSIVGEPCKTTAPWFTDPEVPGSGGAGRAGGAVGVAGAGGASAPHPASIRPVDSIAINVRTRIDFAPPRSIVPPNIITQPAPETTARGKAPELYLIGLENRD